MLKGLNGYDVVSFYDNVGRNSSNSLQLSKGTLFNVENAFDFFMVAKTPTVVSVGWQCLIHMGLKATSINSIWFISTADTKIRWQRASDGSYPTIILDNPNNREFYILRSTLSPSKAASLKKNDTVEGNRNDMHTDPLNRFTMGTFGGSEPADVDFAELIMFDTTSPSRDGIWSYLSKKYNIPITA